MTENSKIKVSVLSLIPNDEISNEIICDSIAFKSMTDINSYIGNEFDIDNFVNSDLKELLQSSENAIAVSEEQKYMVHVFPNHRNMFCCLGANSVIDIYDSETIVSSFVMPHGGLLSVTNNAEKFLDIEVITNNIANKNG